MPKQPQNYKNHARFDPSFHFFLVWVLLINFVLTIFVFIHHLRHPGAMITPRHLVLLTGWLVLMAFAFVLLALKTRMYAIRVQDRLIRLEEHLRLRALGVPQETIGKLTIDQLIGLRFAPDQELPSLAADAAKNSLTRDQIKKKINSWRPDEFRV